MKTSHWETSLVAACGLYCGACRKFVSNKCPGCRENQKAEWCKIRGCCIENGYQSCADCTLMRLEKCKKFNNLVGKLFSVLFKSDRPACIKRIQSIGYDHYAMEMQETDRQAIRRK